MKLKTLLSASALFTVGMLVGRVMGLLREMVIAARYGSSDEASVAIALLIIPDIITAALIGTALGAVMLPAFAARKQPEILALLWQVLWCTVATFGIIALIIMALLPDTPYRSALWLAIACFPLIGATAALTVYLQYRQRFLVPAFASAIFNGMVLLVLLFAPTELKLLALGALSAVAIRLVAHAIAYRRALPQPCPSPSRSWQIDRRLLAGYLHSAGANLLGILPFYLPYAMVAMLSLQSFALFNYAFKLLVFPATLIQTVVYMVILPWFVSVRTHTTTSDTDRYSLSLKLGWVISLALAAAVSLAGEDIARICFGYGAMTDADVAEVGAMISLGIWATPGIVLMSLWQQMLYAHEHTKPVLAANVLLVLLLSAGCLAGGVLAGETGILIGFVLALNAPVLWLALRAGKHVGLRRKPSREYFTTALVMGVLFAPLALLHHEMHDGPLAGLALSILTGLIILAVGMYQLSHVREMARDISRRWLRFHR
ncbi:MAG: lipid II flippase MurJ [Alphaproteobacteria bacterium]|nr:lipid II flippase MurJ [Alphaproteobacteria bacterium]